MRILAAQINPIIGDLKGNTHKILGAMLRGRDQKADLVVLPELALSGYPPEDLLLLPDFIQAINQQLKIIVRASEGIAIIVGFPRQNPDDFEKCLFNSAALIQNGTIVDYADKILLPTYDIFDERRYFEPGDKVKIWNLNGYRIAVTICEDLWQYSGHLAYTHYRRDPVSELVQEKLDCVVNLSASPYSFAKFPVRMEVFSKASHALNCPLICCNQVGGQDSLIFDGRSFFLSPEGILKCAKGFEEDDLLADLSDQSTPILLKDEKIADLFQALVLGLRDYFFKLGFKKGCLGLSGGIDSALVACIAVEALGAENVMGLIMPSRFSSPESSEDALLLAQRLGIETKVLSIEGPFENYLSLLHPYFEGLPFDSTEENLQARIRGMFLMAFSNKFGYLVLSTGNKSEYSMGYSTLYGDMCGGLAVIGDVGKMQVYAMGKWLNCEKELIPSNTLNRAPSAELRPNQKDSDCLPDYEIVDHVVEAYIENHESAEKIAERFHYPLILVEALIRRIHANEYKRRQAPPSLRVSEKAFAVGRRFPIVEGWSRSVDLKKG